jgi:hypothetical protein
MPSFWEKIYEVDGTVLSWEPCDCPDCNGHHDETKEVYLEVQARHEWDAKKVAEGMLNQEYGRRGRDWMWMNGPQATLIGEVPEDRRMAQLGAPRLFELSA